jgi:membrane-associated phospholipid phosphatase
MLARPLPFKPVFSIFLTCRATVKKSKQMKKYTVIILLFTGCSKSLVETNKQFPLLQSTNKDLQGGNWKTILTINKNDFQPAAPLTATDPGYQKQLDEVASLQQNMTAEDRENLNYWGAGAVLRWNEIIRQLVAKYNLAPVNNPDGTYPIPSAANPLAYPFFPFANPPYAARAYAYLSVAQYDALVTAQYWKTQFNINPAYQRDSRIKAMLPDNAVRSYPSSDAVVLGASATVLKLLFPGEINFIDKQLALHKKARLQSGIETAADLNAGETLGQQVAQVSIARARTDRAGTAIGIINGVDLWKEFEQSAITRNEVPWISQESPKRPPMLPYFGLVKPFLFDSTTLVSQVRPGPPPSTNSSAFKQELEEVRFYSKNPSRERIAIVHFWADGVGTYTPPGHWNAIASEAFVELNWSELRWARAMALLNMSLMDAAIACWDAKYTYYNPRPSQVDPTIKTLTGLPNFPAYVSGHSTFSGAAAEILGYLIPDKKNLFWEMANEASLSRLYGAIHYKSDCTVGLTVGKKVAGFAIQRAMSDGAGQ